MKHLTKYSLRIGILMVSLSGFPHPLTATNASTTDSTPVRYKAYLFPIPTAVAEETILQLEQYQIDLAPSDGNEKNSPVTIVPQFVISSKNRMTLIPAPEAYAIAPTTENNQPCLMIAIPLMQQNPKSKHGITIEPFPTVFCKNGTSAVQPQLNQHIAIRAVATTSLIDSKGNRFPTHTSLSDIQKQGLTRNNSGFTPSFFKSLPISNNTAHPMHAFIFYIQSKTNPEARMIIALIMENVLTRNYR